MGIKYAHTGRVYPARITVLTLPADALWRQIAYSSIVRALAAANLLHVVAAALLAINRQDNRQTDGHRTVTYRRLPLIAASVNN